MSLAPNPDYKNVTWKKKLPTWGKIGAGIPGIAVVGSLALHTLVYSTFAIYNSSPKKEQPKSVSIRIVPKEKAVAKAEPELRPPPPVEPKPKPKPKPTEKKVSSERKPKEAPTKPVGPVQGLSPDALSPEGKGIAAPIGNTLMVADEGKRLSEVQPLGNEDLSADARLIRSSIVIPSYTEAAIDAGLEGSYIVDVYVDAKGLVETAELAKKIGYGMDTLLINAAKKARFEPRKDRFGKAQAGWATISFRLELP